MQSKLLISGARIKDQLSIAYLTGSLEVTHNYLTTDRGNWRPRRSIGQMFFQPYESKEEFIYCARHTFHGALFIGMAVLAPAVAIVVPAVMLIGAGICAALYGLGRVCGLEANLLLGWAEFLITDVLQATIDALMSPLSALAMVTRGISTGIHATGILAEPAPTAPCP